MSEQVVSTFLQALIDDKKLLENIKAGMKDIMKDGKVSASDIPEIFNIVIECSENLSKFNLSYNELPDVLNEFINYILVHYDLIPKEEEESFEKMINSAIKLIMLKPKIKSKCLRFWKKIKCCKK